MSDEMSEQNPEKNWEIAFARNRQALDVALSESNSLRQLLEKIRWSDGVEIINLAQFVTLVNSDLHFIMIDLHNAKNPLKQKVYARLLALTIVECFDDLSFLLGKSHRSTLQKIGITSETYEKLDRISESLNKLRRAHEPLLRSIRNYVIAHRDHNAKVQLEWINSLDINSMRLLGIEFFNLLTDLADYFNDLINHLRIKFASITSP